MQRRNFRKASGVILDICKSHGTWLDVDELEQLAGFILSAERPQSERNPRDIEARGARRAEESSLWQSPRNRFTTTPEPNERGVVLSVLNIFYSLLE